MFPYTNIHYAPIEAQRMAIQEAVAGTVGVDEDIIEEILEEEEEWTSSSERDSPPPLPPVSPSPSATSSRSASRSPSASLSFSSGPSPSVSLSASRSGSRSISPSGMSVNAANNAGNSRPSLAGAMSSLVPRGAPGVTRQRTPAAAWYAPTPPPAWFVPDPYLASWSRASSESSFAPSSISPGPVSSAVSPAFPPGSISPGVVHAPTSLPGAMSPVTTLTPTISSGLAGPTTSTSAANSSGTTVKQNAAVQQNPQAATNGNVPPATSARDARARNRAAKNNCQPSMPAPILAANAAPPVAPNASNRPARGHRCLRCKEKHKGCSGVPCELCVKAGVRCSLEG